MSEPSYRILVGDVRERLADLEAGSVDCVVTSPPYFGLRDYGTGEWVGGDPACDHLAPAPEGSAASSLAGPENRLTQQTVDAKIAQRRQQYRARCRRCGAERADQQIGLERTPAEYVAALVEVFREVRRVLAPHGVAWLNLGDSYTSGGRDWYDGGDQVNGEGRGHASRPLTPPGLKAKELIGIPWRTAFALQDDGWWLRSEVIWWKPNPMPESVSDRPTKAHEHVFLLPARERYWWDREAVREPVAASTAAETRPPESFPGRQGGGNAAEHGHRGRPLPTPAAGRNVRTVWEIPTGSFGGAHFAVMPAELARRCVLAGCAREVCRECGRPRERVVERLDPVLGPTTWSAAGAASYDGGEGGYLAAGSASTLKHLVPTRTIGWTDCGHGAYRRGVVLDPFLGAGTTALAALREGRDAVGVELKPEYAEIAERRLSRWWADAPVEAAPPAQEGQLTLS